ncbi:MAG: DMT family transporter [Erysipelotrichaceae bacterium]|nr:DMT family transporter [Erysipelotrichaceae bacterium]
MKREFSILCLFAVALIFGAGYVFQSAVSGYVGPFTLNAIRYIAAGLILMPCLLIRDGTDLRSLMKSGALLGLISFMAPNFQQAAMASTSVGKAAFISTMYIVMVPVLAFLFYRERLTSRVIFSLVLAVIGLYILCDLKITDLSFRTHDVYLLMTALLFALQMVLIERIVSRIHPLKIAAVSDLVGGLLSLVFALARESVTPENLKITAWSIVYLTVVATVIGYSLQFVGQKGVDSTTASLIMSLESVFSVAAGYLFLNQILTAKEIIGCIILFAAVVICQLPEQRRE